VYTIWRQNGIERLIIHAWKTHFGYQQELQTVEAVSTPKAPEMINSTHIDNSHVNQEKL
jgi:hypothetical protein